MGNGLVWGRGWFAAGVAERLWPFVFFWCARRVVRETETGRGKRTATDKRYATRARLRGACDEGQGVLGDVKLVRKKTDGEGKKTEAV